MSTDSAGQTPVWVRLGPGHCSVSGVSVWKNPAQGTCYPCLIRVPSVAALNGYV